MPAPGDPHSNPKTGPTPAAPADVTVESPLPADATLESPGPIAKDALLGGKAPPVARASRGVAPAPGAVGGPARPGHAGLAFDPPAAAGEVGTLGPYRVVKELGHGGMGAVYLAHDTRLNRKLALKVMLPRFAAQPAAKERFLREARAAAQISHDNVVTVYEADERNGVPYIAMQFLKGSSLEDYLRKNGNLAISQILRIAREIASGLAAAHQIGLVHRDIKPANLWLESPNGRVKVLDFGLAKPLDADVELTTSGMIVGTPVFMSPEQARSHQVDARSDLFSLGAVLYRLCSGQLPFQGDTTIALLMALATEEPKPLREINPDVPEPLANLIHQLLAKNPVLRPQTTEEVVKRIRGIAEGVAANRALSPSATPVTDGGPAAIQGQSQVIHVGTSDHPTPGSGLQAVAAGAKIPKKAILAGGGLAAMLVVGVAIAFIVKGKDAGQSKPDLAANVSVPTKSGENAQLATVGPEKAAPAPTSIPTTNTALFAAAVPEAKSRAIEKSVPAINATPTVKSVVNAMPAPPVINGPTTAPALIRNYTDGTAAEWVISQGGAVFTKGSNRAIEKISDLPQDRYILTQVRLGKTATKDIDLAHLKDLKGLDTLSLDNTGISDAGLAQLKNLNGLQQLFLNNSIGVTNAGLDQIQGMKDLKLLWLGHTSVNDAGMARITNFPELRSLGLSGTGVTDAGLTEVSKHKKLLILYLVGTKITDAGLGQLRGLRTLTTLDVRNTSLTRKGLANFHAAVPACRIDCDFGTIEPGSYFPDITVADILTSQDYQWTPARDLGPAMNANVGQADPCVTVDGLEMWFAAAIGNGTLGDIWYTRRRSVDTAWGKPVNAGSSINTPAWESMPRLSADGLRLSFWRQPSNGAFQAFEASRASVNAPWEVATGIAHTEGAVSPMISPDGLELIYTFTLGGKIHHTTRASRTSEWAVPTPVAELQDPSWMEPRWLSSDSRTLIGFVRPSKSPMEYWLTQRNAPGSAWRPRTRLDFPSVRGELSYPFPVLTKGGLELYFSLGGKIQVMGRVTRPKTSATTQDRRAAEWVLSLGGTVKVNGNQVSINAATGLPKVPFTLTGVSLFANKAVTDGGLASLKGLTNLKQLVLYDTPVTDAGLVHIKDLKTLTFLDLGRTKVTDTGLNQIKDLTGLETLALHYTGVSTAWLKNLQNFRALSDLNLNGAVDDAGLAQIQGLTTLKQLHLQLSSVTDAGLGKLKNLKGLTKINVMQTSVSPAGIADFHVAIPTCRIEFTGGVVEPAN